jgi:hypothetical protein
MLSKINLVLVVLSLLLTATLFGLLYNDISTNTQQINNKLNANTDILTTASSDIDKLKKQTPSCELIINDNTMTGDKLCESKGYQYCLMTLGMSQEVFFESNDGTCEKSYTKDYDTRTFECNEKINPNYFDGMDNNRAVCNMGGYLNTDFWSVLLNTKSLCCNNEG